MNSDAFPGARASCPQGSAWRAGSPRSQSLPRTPYQSLPPPLPALSHQGRGKNNPPARKLMCITRTEGGGDWIEFRKQPAFPPRIRTCPVIEGGQGSGMTRRWASWPHLSLPWPPSSIVEFPSRMCQNAPVPKTQGRSRTGGCIISEIRQDWTSHWTLTSESGPSERFGFQPGWKGDSCEIRISGSFGSVDSRAGGMLVWWRRWQKRHDRRARSRPGNGPRRPAGGAGRVGDDEGDVDGDAGRVGDNEGDVDGHAGRVGHNEGDVDGRRRADVGRQRRGR